MIAATRAVLDAVEALVRDPATAAQTATAVAHLAKAAVSSMTESARSPADDAPPGSADHHDGDGGLERIEIT